MPAGGDSQSQVKGRAGALWAGRHSPQPPTCTRSWSAPGPDRPTPAAPPPTWRLLTSTLPSPGFQVLSISLLLHSHSQPRAASLLRHLSVFSLPWVSLCTSPFSQTCLIAAGPCTLGQHNHSLPLVRHRWGLHTLSEMPCLGKCRRATPQRTVTVLRCLGFHSLGGQTLPGSNALLY